MWTAKTKILLQVLATCGCLLLAVPAPGAAQETLHEPLPVGARARLGRGVVGSLWRGLAGSLWYSPDGSRLLVSGGAGLWRFDAQTYEAESLSIGHLRYLSEDTYARFSPDFRSLVSFGGNGLASFNGNPDTNIRLWDAATGTLRHTLKGHRYKVNDVIFSPDGQTLASDSEYGTVRLWDAATGTLRHTLYLRGHRTQSGTIVFSPDSRTLAIVHGGDIQLWDVAAGALRHTLDQASRDSRIAFSPDSRTLAGGDNAGTVRLWDTATGALQYTLQHPNTPFHGGVRAVAFSPDGRTLASFNGNPDTNIRLWDAAAGTLRHTLRPRIRPHSPARIQDPTFSPDGRILASVGRDIIYLWDPATGRLRQTLGFSRLGPLTFSADGRTLASTIWGGHRAVELWDAATGRLRHTLDSPREVDSVTFSPDGQTFATTAGRGWDTDGAVQLWDTHAGALRYTLEGHSVTSAVAFSPDGRTFATVGTLARAGSADVGAAGVRLWDTDTGALRYTLDPHDTGWYRIGSLIFSPDGRTLASTGRSEDGRTGHLWDVTTGTLRHTLRTGLHGVVRVAFSPDGRTLASVHWESGIQLWDVASGARHALLHPSSGLSIMAFSPDSRTLAYRCIDKTQTICLWDTAAGTLRHTLSHGETVNNVAFSPDSRIFATGGNDSAVRLWDAAAGIPRHTLQGHGGDVSSVAFSPDGRTLASGSGDGTALLWDVVADAATGDFRNLATNPGGQWAVWRSDTTVTVRFDSPRARVQHDARRDPQPQFVLPEGFRPATRVVHTVTGTRVNGDGTPVPDAPPAAFDLAIAPNGEVHYLDNPKVDGLGYVNYRVTRLTWPTNEVQEIPSTFGTGETPASGSDPDE